MERCEIYCPLCEWRPSPEDRWCCTRSGCGAEWNTFGTRGVCPSCTYSWRNTQCYGCWEMSPHESWYHYPAPQEAQEVGERAGVSA